MAESILPLWVIEQLDACLRRHDVFIYFYLANLLLILLPIRLHSA